MAEPVTLTVSAIAALAFSKFLESGAGEAAKSLTPAVLDKIDALRQRIWAKLRGIPEVNALNAAVEQGVRVNDQQIQLLTPYLEAAMKEDTAFAHDVQQLASEINQEINIGEIQGKNVQNIYGGSAVQINDPKNPVLTGDNSGTINLNITN